MKRKRGLKVYIYIVFSMICLFIICFMWLMPFSKGIPKAFLDEDGKVIKDSISEKVNIEIKGYTYGMFIKGINVNKPVLLLLHGGPGLTDYFLAQQTSSNLESEFVVCYFEQLGTGLSYNKDIDVDDMHTTRFINDIVEVTHYLKDRFNQEKIYLLGHSFGSYLGLKTASLYPELFHAYMGMSQIVDQLTSEKNAYQYMLETYQANGNKKRIKQLKAFDISNEVEFKKYLNSNLRDLAMHELGVGTTHDMDSVITGLFFPSLKCIDYTVKERIDIWKGKVFSRSSNLMNEVYAFNAYKEIQALEIPIYMFAGKFDYTVDYNLQKAYFDSLDAPIKGFYTFDDAAHSPIFEEPEKAIEIIKIDIFNLCISLSDIT